MYLPQYSSGARIFSESWGGTSNSYTYMDTESDRIMANVSDRHMTRPSQARTGPY
jgi:hypothetical protein